MRTYLAELHVHTVLSPCAGVEMIPPLIVKSALQNDIHLIAITDHNASDNVGAVMKAAENEDLTVLPGMEIQTAEEVHSLCLFDTLEQLFELQSIVDQNLPKIDNNIDFFGEQFVVDYSGAFIRRKEQLLITSTNLSFNETYKIVDKLEGLFIPAHVDRQAFGLFYHLGFVPQDLPLIAMEISRHISPEEAVKKFPQLKDFPLLQSGDVHFISDFLGANRFELHEPTISEIKLAFRGEKERKVEIITRN